MNFFTGFFTTAEDWKEGQDYHLEKRKLFNRGLHTAGVIQGEAKELRVEAARGLNVRVLPGAALDSDGNLIYLGQARTLPIKPDNYKLPQLVYIAIEYHEEPSDHVENKEHPEYSGDTRVAEIPRLSVATTQPDNRNSLELARIELQPKVTRITDPKNPHEPEGNEIDRRYVVWAGSVRVRGPRRLPPDILEDLIQRMGRTRRDFAALAGRFPVPSASDVRHAALTVEILTPTGFLHTEHLSAALTTISSIEQDVGQELAADYPAGSESG